MIPTHNSFSAAIPAILSRLNVVISTATKALQEQISKKDVPYLQTFLQENYGFEFTWTLLKGRTNYICPARAEIAEPHEVPNLARILRYLDEAGPDFSGDRNDFPVDIEISDQEWSKIHADTEDCSALGCSKKRGPDGLPICYATRARKRAEVSQVVIVNHALFISDLQVSVATDGMVSMIGPYDAVIFDEAHELEEYAVNALGTQVTERGLLAFTSEIRNFARHVGPVGGELENATIEVASAVANLWRVLKVGRIRLAELEAHADEFVGLVNSIGQIRELLMDPRIIEYITVADEVMKKRLRRLRGRSASLHNRLTDIVSASFEETVRWVETDRDKLVLKVAPIEVGPWLNENLFSQPSKTAILLSATLTVNGKFDYVASRLGIRDYEGLDVGTPFDYSTQAVLYVPTSIPEPAGQTRSAWSSAAVGEMFQLIQKAGGRALLLFTSRKEMELAYGLIRDRLRLAGLNYDCFMQGQAPNHILAARFRKDITSILFATRSFMSGVDFPGQTLSLVIIDKLPFPVPTEPMTEARCEAIVRRGGSDFTEYVIPTMTLVLKQAFGRLIRHRDDRGVVAILDPRLEHKGYGRKIISSLPPARKLNMLSQVTFEGVV